MHKLLFWCLISIPIEQIICSTIKLFFDSFVILLFFHGIIIINELWCEYTMMHLLYTIAYLYTHWIIYLYKWRNYKLMILLGSLYISEHNNNKTKLHFVRHIIMPRMIHEDISSVSISHALWMYNILWHWSWYRGCSWIFSRHRRVRLQNIIYGE